MMREMSATDQAEFLAHLKAGDERAWAKFVQEQQTALYNYLETHLPDQESVDDVVNETLLASVKAIQNLDGNVSLRTMVIALASRKLADFWRRRQATQPMDNRSSSPGSLDEGVHGKLMMQSALSRLPETYAEVLVLRYTVGLSIGEIAEVMQRSRKAVESLLSRARQQLKDTLDDYEAEDQAQQTDAPARSVLQILTVQAQRCKDRGMEQEAALFTQSFQQLVALSETAFVSVARLDHQEKLS